MSPLKLSLILLTVSLSVLPRAEAKPFRAMVTRTTFTTGPQHLELGLRYQGFFGGDGLNSPGYSQLTPGVRFGIVERLELNLHLDLMLIHQRNAGQFAVYVGDLPIGLQFTFLNTPVFSLGVYGRLTIPVGTSLFQRLAVELQDRIPPSLSDGTWDAEGTLIAEVRPSQDFTLMANVGYLFHGVRQRGGAGAFDVPDAILYNFAATLNVGQRVLLGVELAGRSYFDQVITPAWTNNQHQLEVIPHARFEVVPNFVLEAALGIGLTRDLGEIYRVRLLLGFTYEFDILGRRRG
ncbi:MAG: hypothetical protein Q8N23_13460 [Archangium sp.]|nr:hypothetical protein [Archangium sp.]MDP3153680.1 hypothetical protein [Archangium sp.]MDP3569271.1 hypothetical protein [Archangium sp.]